MINLVDQVIKMDVSCKCKNPATLALCCDSYTIGSDDQEGRYGDVSVLKCRECKSILLRYYYTIEGISNSGRWWLAEINKNDIEKVTPYNALRIIEKQISYLVGGSYYDGKIYKSSGTINELTPKQFEIYPETKLSETEEFDQENGENQDDGYDDLNDLFFPDRY